MDNELAERLDKIEATVAHLERLGEQLNEVVVEHGKRLAKLQSHLQRVGQTLETFETERIKATNPKPPHYQ